MKDIGWKGGVWIPKIVLLKYGEVKFSFNQPFNWEHWTCPKILLKVFKSLNFLPVFQHLSSDRLLIGRLWSDTNKNGKLQFFTIAGIILQAYTNRRLTDPLKKEQDSRKKKNIKKGAKFGEERIGEDSAHI